MLASPDNKALWDARALDASLPEDAVTHTDRQQRLLEIEIMLQRLPRGQRVLDVGCGNGYSTAVLARHAARVVAIDYSAPMIERARKAYQEMTNVEFHVKDVLALDLPLASFDVAVSQRCLINLPSWEHQQQALAHVTQVLKRGGLFILQEGTKQGRETLNQVRECLGLKRMPPVTFNLDFDEDLLWPFLRRDFEIVEIRRFGLYDLISRVVHPLLVSPEEPKYDAKINEVARRVSANLTAADELSREFTAVLRRHG